MAQTSIVNKFGRMLGWNQVKLVLYGRTVEGVSELSYNDSVEKEVVMGAGRMPIGTAEGPYKAEASLTLYIEEYNALLDSMPANTRIQDIPATDVPVLYELRNTVKKDVLRNMEFTGATKEVKQGDKVIAMKMGVFITHIDWNQQ